MYNLFPAISLMLPSFGFATPTQAFNSLGPNGTGSLSANDIGPEPIDIRFSMQAFYQGVSLAEDDCLVAAVQLLGLWGSTPFLSQEPTRVYWDDRFPHVEISSRSPRTGGTMEVRCLVWGLYLGVKNMIESNRFQNVQFVLRWEWQIVAMISIRKRGGPLSLPGEKSINSTNTTNILRQRSSSNQLNIFATENLDGISFNLSIPSMSVKVVPLGSRPLPKYNFIMAILDGILAVASRATISTIPEPVQVQPPAPYGAKLRVVPERATPGQPSLTFGMVALALRQIPACLLLRVHQWVEVDFEILFDEVLKARGALSGV